MSEVSHTIKETYVVDTRDAIAQTQRLADSHTKGAKQAAKALDDFERDAMRALGKVEKSVEAQSKAWAKAQKAMEDGGSGIARAFDKGRGVVEGFNKTVGFLNQTMGSAKIAIELGATAVNLLGKAWSGLSDALGSSPQLRMMWEKSPHEQWITMFEEKRKAAEAWSAAMQETYFGADVDSPANMARRLASRERVAREKAAKGAIGMAAFQEYIKDQGQAFDPDAFAKFQAQARPDVPRPRGGSGRAGRTPEDDLRLALAFSEGMARLQAVVDSAPGAIDPIVASMAGEGSRFSASAIGDTSAIDALMAGFSPESGNRTGFGLGEFQTVPEGPGLLERVFGPREDFDFYADALGTLRDATSEVYTALVTGSESAGAALKRVVGTAIMAEGSRMAIEALKEGAYAIADLAKGNLPGAALHGKAAAGFLAGSVAAGVAASALGAGGSSTPTASTVGGGAATGVNVAAGGADPVNQTFIFGDSFGYSSPRTQAAFFRQAQNQANRYSRPAEGVE